MRILLVFIFLLTCTFVSPNDLHQRKRRFGSGNIDTPLDEPEPNRQNEPENKEPNKTHKVVINNLKPQIKDHPKHDAQSKVKPEGSGKVNPQIQDDKQKKKTELPVPNSDKPVSKAPNNIPEKTDVPRKVQDETKNISSNDNPAGNFQEESGFLKTSMIILVTSSIAFIIFVAYKTYRRSYRSARIRKYGVRLARGNIEMTPLPLDNDDDDETVFDLKNVPI